MKRLDIQGLRAVAIILVLLFHFYPNFAPNGYVGVDMFFVISGYLMAFLLARPATSFLSKYFDFIYRRCKRIIPMAYLIIAITYLAIQLYFPTLADYNNEFSIKALLFYANYRTDDELYEEQLSDAVVVFTHYWSLSVEMQFYLVAPFIYWIATKAMPNRPYLPCLLIGVISIAYHSTLSASDSFNSTLGRLWQFMAGYLAFFLGEEAAPTDMSNGVHGDEKDYARLLEDEVDLTSDKEDYDAECCVESKQKTSWTIFGYGLSHLSYGISVLLLFLPFFRYNIPYCRIVATINSAVLIYLNRDSYLLSNPVMGFIGDISYSLYLVHWPVLCFGKYLTTDCVPSSKIVALYLTSAVIIAIVLHYSFERYYVRWSKAVIIALSTGLLCSCVALVYIPVLELENSAPGEIPLFYENAARLNYNNTKREILRRNYRVPELCQPTLFYGNSAQREVCEFPPGEGNLTVLIVGNSYAANQAGIIYAHIKKHAASVTLLWKAACESIIQTIGYDCNGDPTAMEFIEKYRPDVLFVVERYLTMKSPIEGNLLTDPTMIKLKEQIPILEKSVRKILIIGAIPMVNRLSATRAYKWLKHGRPLESLAGIVAYDEYPATLRLSELAKTCQKCTVYDWGYLFNYNGTSQNFQYYDKTAEEMYFDDWIHLNNAGKKKIQPLYREISEAIGQLIRNKTFI